jgi:hypothetical protein
VLNAAATVHRNCLGQEGPDETFFNLRPLPVM